MAFKYGPNDAIVAYPDAEVWSEDLLKMPPKELEAQLLELEPAVLGMAMHRAAWVQTLLTRAGVNPKLAMKVADEVTRTGAMCCELTRRGYGKFLADLIEPPAQDEGEQKQKETDHDE